VPRPPGDDDRGLGELGAAALLLLAALDDLAHRLAASEMVTSTTSTARRPKTSCGPQELGLTVMIGVPLVTFASTV
jgi:hypothetical protein